ncbi:MAG TPA: MarR family transcriptional regulator [Rectinemataceae bacterium]|nr:MarR family transcriptional regulator [Rectinemataceae bacterium]
MPTIRTQTKSGTTSDRDELSFRIALQLREINAVVNARVATELASTGLTMPQITAIRLIAHGGEVSVSELCSQMNASPATVVGIIDRLEEGGIVVRRRDETDRRVVKLSLTSRGSRNADQARLVMGSCFARAFSTVELGKLQTVNDSLSEILNALQGVEPPIQPASRSL